MTDLTVQSPAWQELLDDDMYQPKDVLPLLYKILPWDQFPKLADQIKRGLDPSVQRLELVEPAQADQLATDAFAYLQSLLAKTKTNYVYYAQGTLFYGFTNGHNQIKQHSQNKKPIEINCYFVTKTFIQFLYFLGVPKEVLKQQAANVREDDNIKLARKQMKEIKKSDVVMFVNGKSTSYTVPKSISFTNAVKLRRAQPPDEKRRAGTISVVKSERNPYQNHLVAYVGNSYVKTLPYFDLITDCRYQNGQDDLFAFYKRRDVELEENKKIESFVRQGSAYGRLYEIPRRPLPCDLFQSIREDQTYKEILKSLEPVAPVWWIVDEEDLSDPHFDPVTGTRKNPGNHPVLMLHLYGLVTPFLASDLAAAWDSAKQEFERSTGKRKPSATILGIRTSSGIEPAIADVAKVFFLRDGSYAKALAKLQATRKSFQATCDAARKQAGTGNDSQVYLEQLDLLLLKLDTIIANLISSRAG